MVINLNRITPGNPAGQDDLIASIRQQFRQALGNEYVQALVNAARRSVEHAIDEETVEQLRRELSGAAAAPNS
jgi:hypothetical protein